MQAVANLSTIFIVPLCFILLHYGDNINKVEFQEINLTLVSALVSSLLITGVFQLITKSVDKSKLLSNLFFFFFFNFSNISKVINNKLLYHLSYKLRFFSYRITEILCVILLGILFIIFIKALLKKNINLESCRRINNFFLIGMIGIVAGYLLFPLVQNFVNPSKSSSEKFYDQWQESLFSETTLLQPEDQLPDFYYIILDGYGSEKVLEEFYDYDNSSFLHALTDQGFTISNDSLTNYKQTDLSISSLLNMDYINWVGESVGIRNPNYFPIFFLIDHNRVFEQLRRIGYRINTFTTGFEVTEIDTADLIFKPRNYPNDFEELMISTTPLSILWDANLYSIHRERIRYDLRNLAVAGNQDGPDFVFVHIPAPHPPFVFGPDGEDATPNRPFTNLDAAEFLEVGSVEEYKKGYTDQLSYINKEVLSAIQTIMQTSDTPPIIVIQSDHGPGSEFDHQLLENSNLTERYPILYASFLPCEKNEIIPKMITPVNSFRFIFNTCFNADLPYLQNRQYYSSSLLPYDFTDVTEALLKDSENKNNIVEP